MPTYGLIYPHQCFEYRFLPKKWKKIYFIMHNIVYDKHFLKIRHDYYKKVNNYWIHHCPIKVISVDNLPSIDKGISIEYFDPADNTIDKEIKKAYPHVQMLPSPSFILAREECYELPSYRMYDFYKKMRVRYNILVDRNGEPTGGKWRFDEENRDSAKHLNMKSLPKNPAIFPTTHREAKTYLRKFLRERLKLFGQFQDAFTTNGDNLYHSLISVPLNCGLLTPMYVIKKILHHYRKYKIPIASVEGIIAQILGWREYMRALYYTRDIPKINHRPHAQTVPKSWYKGGKTGIAPVDKCLEKVYKTGYLHHIERLMIMGNIMFLMNISPREMYKWFLYMFIDSFPWVMYGNVYKMLQTPYISSSKYILRMSNYPRGDWCDVWDKLYQKNKKYKRHY